MGRRPRRRRCHASIGRKTPINCNYSTKRGKQFMHRFCLGQIYGSHFNYVASGGCDESICILRKINWKVLQFNNKGPRMLQMWHVFYFPALIFPLLICSCHVCSVTPYFYPSTVHLAPAWFIFIWAWSLINVFRGRLGCLEMSGHFHFDVRFLKKKEGNCRYPLKVADDFL